MKRTVLSLVIGGFVVLFAGAAVASQCPKLIAQINAAAGNRFDATAAEARGKAAQADSLHKAGKHAESEAAAKEALGKLGVSVK
jgi:hypothetical protein